MDDKKELEQDKPLTMPEADSYDGMSEGKDDDFSGLDHLDQLI